MKKYILLLILSVGATLSFSQEPITWKTEHFNLQNTEIGDTVELVFKATLNNGYYMYATDFSCEIGPVPVAISYSNKSLQAIDSLKSVGVHSKLDKDWDCQINVFEKEAELRQSFVIKATENLEYSIQYQTCKLDVNCIPGKLSGQIVFKPSAETIAQVSDSTTSSLDCTPLSSVDGGKKKGILLFVFAAFLAGILTVFMPCIFPLMPMTVSYFSKGTKSKQETIKKVLFYGLSIVLIYTALAIFPSMFLGSDRVNNWLSTHWIPNAIFFLIFIVFGMSFLGAFELRLPNKWANQADSMADKGGYLGLFFMALTLIIVSFSCTGPFLSSILILSSKGGMSAKPLLGMLAYSFGFALPFVLLAITPKLLSKLPKSGSWMNVSKVIFGILELGLALKFLSTIDLVYGLGILDKKTFLTIWAVLGLILSIYLLGIIKFSHDSDQPVKLSVGRLMLASFSLFASIYFVSGVFDRPVLVLSGIVPPAKNQVTHSNLCESPKYGHKLHSPSGYDGYFDMDQAVQCAKEQNKLVLIDFTGHGCANCRNMEDKIWTKSSIKSEIESKYVLVSLYVDDKTQLDKIEYIKDEKGQEIKSLGERNLYFEKEKFCEVSQPLYVVYDPSTGETIKRIGYTSDASEFQEFLR
jgi:thiol:disulfide interchange protein